MSPRHQLARLLARASRRRSTALCLARATRIWLAGNRGWAIAVAHRYLEQQEGEVQRALLRDLAHLPDHLRPERRQELESFIRHLLGACARIMARRLARQQDLEATLRARSHELEEAHQQLQALDQVRRNLFSNVTHELRTPLSGILGYAEILEDEVGDRLSAEQRSFMRALLNEGYHLRDLINTLLDMSQLAAGNLALDRQPLSLELLAHEACDHFGALAQEHQQKLICEIDPNLPFVEADPARTFQVLGHLLSNALKFTPAGGTVRVRVQRDRSTLRVEVCDNGVGISPEQLPLLFTSFFQADPSPTRQVGGLGLGLSLSRRLIELQGGQIWAESVPGRGSCFRFTLPIGSNCDDDRE